MKFQADTMYSVAPLDRSDIMKVVDALEAEHQGGGVVTFEICRKVAMYLPDASMNLCAARPDRYMPCNTLCYVCIEVLYELLLRAWERDKE